MLGCVLITLTPIHTRLKFAGKWIVQLKWLAVLSVATPPHQQHNTLVIGLDSNGQATVPDIWRWIGDDLSSDLSTIATGQIVLTVYSLAKTADSEPRASVLTVRQYLTTTSNCCSSGQYGSSIQVAQLFMLLREKHPLGHLYYGGTLTDTYLC